MRADPLHDVAVGGPRTIVQGTAVSCPSGVAALKLEREPWELHTSLRRHPLVLLLVATCAGSILDRQVSRGMGWWWGACLLLGLWWVLGRRASARGRTPSLAPLFLLGAVALLMATWHHMQWRLYGRHHVGLAVLRDEGAVPVAVRGRIISSPEWRPRQRNRVMSTLPATAETRFAITVHALRSGMRWVPATGRLAVRVHGHVFGVSALDDVELFGKLRVSRGPMNPGEQDLRLRERVERILAHLEVPYPECVTCRSRRLWRPRALLGSLRAAGLRHLATYVGEEEGRLAGALLLGARNQLEYGRLDPFFLTGTIHLLAISGLHVGLLAAIFFGVAKRCARRRMMATVLVMGVTALYCCLTGSHAPAMRAATLVQVACVGLICRRNVRPYNAIAAAALVVLIRRPGDLFRAGAQLSFLAVVTLTWLATSRRRPTPDPLGRLIERSRPWHERVLRRFLAGLGRVTLASLVVWGVTLPLVMGRYHLVSPASVPLNVAFAAPVAVALLASFLVVSLGSVLPPAAAVMGRLCGLSLAMIEETVCAVQHVPGAYWWVSGPSDGWCIVFYVGLWIFAVCKRMPRRRTLAVIAIVAWLGLACLANRSQRVPGDVLRCTFLSMGHGTCVVVELPDGRTLVYDAGRMGAMQHGVRTVSSFLWHRGIHEVDAIVLSHADADHYNAVPDLVRRFSVQQIFVAPNMFRQRDSALRDLRASLVDAGIPVVTICAGDQLAMQAGALIRVLHPRATDIGGSDNAKSLVLELEFQGRRVLLPGDLESPGLERLLGLEVRDVDVLMAPHHGSLRSSPHAIGRWCSPEWVVISGGHDRHAARRRDAYRHSNCRVLDTSRDGAVTVTISPGTMEVETFRSNSSTRRP